MKTLVMIQPFVHKVYWGWIDYLTKNYDFYLISKNFKEKEKEIISSKKKTIRAEKTAYLSKLGLKKTSIFIRDFRKIEGHLKKIEPDIIMSKVLHQPFTIRALNFAIKKDIGEDFYIITEQRRYPKHKIGNLIFKLYSQYLKYKLQDKNFLATTRDSKNFLDRLGFEKTFYTPPSLYKTGTEKKKSCFSNKLNFCSVTKLKKTKGIDIVLEAVKYLLEEENVSKKDIEYSIIGKGGKEEQLKEKAKHLNLKNVVNFKGYIPNEEINKEFRKHDFSILPSRSDPIGLVTLEAMANGLPVIVSKKAGSHCFIEKNENGYKFDPNKPKELAEKILKLKDKKRKEKFSRRSIEIINKNHDVIKNGKKLDKIINKPNI